MNEILPNEPFYITYKLVEEMLQKHDVHCVFELDAPMQIFTRLMSSEFYTTHDVRGREAEFRGCWALSEIYCPHEGIDRRREYGMETV